MQSLILLAFSAFFVAASAMAPKEAPRAGDKCSEKEDNVPAPLNFLAPGFRSHDFLACDVVKEKYVATKCEVRTNGNALLETVPKGMVSKGVFGTVTEKQPDQFGVHCSEEYGSRLQNSFLPSSVDSCTYDKTADPNIDKRRTLTPFKPIQVDKDLDIAITATAILKCKSDQKPEVVRCVVFKGKFQDRLSVFSKYIYDMSKREEVIEVGQKARGPTNTSISRST